MKLYIFFLVAFLFVTVLLIANLNFAEAQTDKVAVRITPQESGVEASFRGLAVRNENEAWVTGSMGTVIRTTDAGRNWKRIVVPDSDELDFRDVEVLPDGTVLLMSIGNGDASRILRSNDSGKTWQTVLANKDANGFFDGMTFAPNNKTGVLFGDPINGRMDLYHTNDSGKTWTRLPEKQRPVMSEGEYGFAASGTGVVVQGKNIWIATGGSVARIHHSPDAGNSWQTHDTPIRSGNESSGIFSLEFLDPNNAVAIGGDYLKPDLHSNNVATSSDGGNTWSIVPAVQMQHKACVQSVGNHRLLTCGRTGVAFSANAGRNWTTLTKDGYFTLAADRKSGTGFLAGKDGSVARFELKAE